MESLVINLELLPVEKYPAKQHAQRVAAKLGVSDGLIYLLGQYEFSIEDSDQPKTFYQRRYFYYCTGVDEPNCCATYDIKKDELVLYIPEIDPTKVIWRQQPPTLDEALDRYDVDIVRHNSHLFSTLKRWKRDNPDTTFYILHKHQIPDLDVLTNVDREKLQPAMDQCRVIKDDFEVKCIRKANEVSASGHRAVMGNVKIFSGEPQIQGWFEMILTNLRTKRAYETIAGSGENASVLHYSKNDELLEGRQLVCLDAGAEYSNYASDVTRTFPISGYFSKEAEQIYSLVELMQESSILMCQPGVHMMDLQVHVHKLLTEGFLRLGLFHNGTMEDILEAGTSKGFLPHGLGHHLGLDVHDVLKLPIMNHHQGAHQRYPALVPDKALALCRADHPELEEGMVVTIEPGIYFNRYELNRAYLNNPVHSKFINKDVLERYWAVGGVRIEDDILITANGYRNLTTAPKGKEMLEIIRTRGGCEEKTGRPMVPSV